MQSSARTTWWAPRLLAFTCMAAAMLAIAPSGASAAYNFQTSWGNAGSGPGQLYQPTGVDVDGSDNVFVADYGNNRIQVFDSGGTPITGWGGTGVSPGQFRRPYDVAADTTGNVYVADGGNDRIQIFTAQGGFVDQFGTAGIGPGEFQIPTAVALDSLGNVYVLDWGNNRVQKFSAQGLFIGQWGSPGNGDGEFSNPFGLEVDGTDNVYVSDYGNDRVQKFSSTGLFLGKWGGTGTGDGQFDHPTGITTDSLGNVSVVDYSNNRVQYFGPDGTFLGKFGSSGPGDGEFTLPWGIAEGSLGTLFVSDSGNSRIERFGETQNGSTVRRRGSELIFQARSAHANDITVAHAGDLYTFTDPGDAVLPGAGCSASLPNVATCSDAAISTLRVDADDMGDSVINTTDTVATLNGGTGDDQLTAGSGGGIMTGDLGDDTLIGGGGASDTASYAEAGAGVIVNLSAPGAQDTGGAGTDTLAGIENLAGSGQGDNLTGDGAANTLSGAGGNDTLSGSDGDDALEGGPGTSDTVSFAGSGSGVTVDLSITSPQPTGAGTDTISAVENLTGSPQADTLAGDAAPNTIAGGDGDDTLRGRTGDDTIDGGPGSRDVVSYSDAVSPVLIDLANPSAQPTGMGSDTVTAIEGATGGAAGDTLQGNGGDNPLDGGPGDDTLRGGPGDDVITGGTGTDAADYSSASSAVTVNLSAPGAQTTGGAGSDILTEVEDLTGSPQDDQLTGDGGANSLVGAGGADTLRGEGGADALAGGPGTDTADYSDAPSGVTVNLSVQGAQDTGGAGPDSLAGVEDLVGSAHADTLTGSDDPNSIAAGDGADILRTLDTSADQAACGAGLDTINGDALDTIDPDCEAVTIGVQPPPGGAAPPAPAPPDHTAPVLSGVSVPLMRSGLGGPISYRLSEPSRTTFRFDRVQLGRRVKGRCARATRRNLKRRTCRRYLYAGAVAVQSAGGQNAYAFSGRVGSTPLKPGPYRLTIVATDAAGNRSTQVTAKFAVIR